MGAAGSQEHVVAASYRVGDPLPQALTAQELMRALRVSQAHYYNLLKAGKLRAFELTPALGQAKYSGARVQQYLEGERLMTSRHLGQGRRERAARQRGADSHGHSIPKGASESSTETDDVSRG